MSDELFVQELSVIEGHIPKDLDGQFLRNGSNPYYTPYAGYHWWVDQLQSKTQCHHIPTMALHSFSILHLLTYYYMEHTWTHGT